MCTKDAGRPAPSPLDDDLPLPSPLLPAVFLSDFSALVVRVLCAEGAKQPVFRPSFGRGRSIGKLFSRSRSSSPWAFVGDSVFCFDFEKLSARPRGRCGLGSCDDGARLDPPVEFFRSSFLLFFGGVFFFRRSWHLCFRQRFEVRIDGGVYALIVFVCLAISFIIRWSCLRLEEDVAHPSGVDGLRLREQTPSKIFPFLGRLSFF